MNENNLIEYYNKFNEDKRLKRRHGQVEFLTTIKYIEKYLKDGDKILDVGAGTGVYSEYFNNKYDVVAVELVKHNLRYIEEKGIECYQGNATDLSRFDDNSFDIVLLFGPLYHLISYENKLKALKEAKRVVKNDGLIFISYCMNDFAIIKHGFMERNILDSVNNKLIDDNFNIVSKDTDLYSFVRIEDIYKLKDDSGLREQLIINQDGPCEYMRSDLNKLNDEEFSFFLKYHFSVCERIELLGAGRHILHILKK